MRACVYIYTHGWPEFHHSLVHQKALYYITEALFQTRITRLARERQSFNYIPSNFGSKGFSLSLSPINRYYKNLYCHHLSRKKVYRRTKKIDELFLSFTRIYVHTQRHTREECDSARRRRIRAPKCINCRERQLVAMTKETRRRECREGSTTSRPRPVCICAHREMYFHSACVRLWSSEEMTIGMYLMYNTFIVWLAVSMTFKGIIYIKLHRAWSRNILRHSLGPLLFS